MSAYISHTSSDFDFHLIIETILNNFPSFLNCKPLTTTIQNFKSVKYFCLWFYKYEKLFLTQAELF